jgi:hypothetical protein
MTEKFFNSAKKKDHSSEWPHTVDNKSFEKGSMTENVDFLCGGRVSRARLQSPHHYVLAGPSARAVPAEVAASTPINRNRF